jgi:hypothetical protein
MPLLTSPTHKKILAAITDPPPIARRWGYLALVVVISVFTFCLLFFLAAHGGRATSGWFSGVDPWVLFLFRVALSIAVVGMIVRLTPIRWSQMPAVPFYPPTWLGIAVGFFLASFIDASGSLGRGQLLWWEWLVLSSTGLAAVGVLQWLTSRPPDPSPESGVISHEPEALEWSVLQPWLEAQKPADDDLLGRRRVARRFLRHLLTPFGEDRTIGLVGGFGVGKTSIIRWLKREAAEAEDGDVPRLWFSEVSCWGFEDSVSAIQHILTSALAEVGKHADCFSLRQIPDSYRKALSAGGSWWPTVADLFLGQPDPTEALKRLTPVLQALNARLVVVVEDMDRNQSGRFDPMEVQATLQRLRSVRGVSFILSGGATPKSKIDFARLCDHIEILGDVEPKYIQGLILALRRKCLSMASVDPGASDQRNEAVLWGCPDPHAPGAIFMGPGEITSPVSKLLSAPRALNHALRHTWRVWGRLPGEVDFDDLLAVNVLRYGAPEAFNFLLRRMDDLRTQPPLGIPSTSDDRDEDGDEESHLPEWAQACANVEWDSESALELIGFLVPGATGLLPEVPRHRASCPQGVRWDRPNDYWRRMLEEESPEGEVRDQEVLQGIEEWVRDPSANGALAQRLVSSGRFADIWEHFADRVTGKDVLLLAGQVLAEVMRAEGAKASDSNPAVSALRRRVDRYGSDEPKNKMWLIERICEALPVSLNLATDLYDHWANVGTPFVKRSDIAEIRIALIERAREVYGGSDPRRLLTALHADRPYALRWLVLPTNNNNGEAQIGSGDWLWLGETLVAAAHRDPGSMVVLIGYLLTESSGERGMGRESIMPDRLEAIFGTRSDEILDLLGGDPGQVPDSQKPFAQEIRRVARSARSGSA